MRLDVDVRIQILQVEPDDDREQNQSDIDRTVPIEQVVDRIDLADSAKPPAMNAAGNQQHL